MTGHALELRTGAWYGDVPLELDFPESWDVKTHWPVTPPPLLPAQLAERVASPVGRGRVRELAAGKVDPVILVDDLTRPTPADRVLPLLLEELRAEAAAACRFRVHDDGRDLVRVGRTSFGTAVYVNRAVAAADLVLGIGGIYPQHAVGFGGGSKLALGVLGRQTIATLHYGHPSMGGSYDIDNDFRRDLEEIARMIGLSFVCSVHVNAQREIVRLVCGDPAVFHAQEVAFAKSAFAAPLPGDADVVVSNTYPIDVSVTFMRSKGVTPLLHAGPQASKILIAACSEGLGHHGLYPFVDASRLDAMRNLARTLRARPGSVPRKAAARLAAPIRRRTRAREGATRSATALGTSSAFPIHLLTTQAPDLPPLIRGMVTHASWASLRRRVAEEQGDRTHLNVVVYPCAPLQVMAGAEPEPGPVGVAERSSRPLTRLGRSEA